MMKQNLFFYSAVALCLLCVRNVPAQEAPVTSPEMGTTFPLVLDDLCNTVGLAANRAELQSNLYKSLDEAFANPNPDLTSETLTGSLCGAMWACNILQQPLITARDAIGSMLRRYPEMQEDLARKTLECAYGQFRYEFADEMTSVAKQTSVPKHFAMASVHLLRQNRTKYWPQLRQLMVEKWPAWSTNPILTMVNYLGENAVMPRRPSLVPLLSSKFAPGKPVLYTFQRENRDHEGVAVVRRPDGRFVRTVEGNLWNIAHLTRANSNMPGFLTNGNTPQGVHTIVGVGQTSNTFIGRTPYLESALPVEHTPEIYFHDPLRAGTSWTLQMYEEQLPEEWRGYWPMHTAWYAGMAGRSEMLCHGTTANPAWYKGLPFYPNTPSLGCLTAKEIWDPKTGKALHSDQLELYTAWIRACQNRDYAPQSKDEPVPVAESLTGFLVVVELNASPCPVTLSEVLTDVFEAESLTTATAGGR